MISQEELKACTYNLLKERGVTVQDIADIVMMIQQPYIPDLTMDECVESVQAVLENEKHKMPSLRAQNWIDWQSRRNYLSHYKVS